MHKARTVWFQWGQKSSRKGRWLLKGLRKVENILSQLEKSSFGDARQKVQALWANTDCIFNFLSKQADLSLPPAVVTAADSSLPSIWQSIHWVQLWICTFPSFPWAVANSHELSKTSHFTVIWPPLKAG